jgi:hypothetical protein
VLDDQHTAAERIAGVLDKAVDLPPLALLQTSGGLVERQKARP